MHFAPPKPRRRDRKPRRLWLHAGLHKTGTTSLQSFLVQNREHLASRGLLYVRAGTNQYLDGNHNVAWELTGDRRFELDTGVLEEAVQEIDDFEGDAILSSEDFESLLSRPKGFDPLLRHPLLRSHQIIVVVYVRNQAEYLASLMWENRKHGLGWGLMEYLDRILRDGSISTREWMFQFDLLSMAQFWPYRNAKLLVRNYHRLMGGSSVFDFMSLVTPEIEPGQDLRLNTAPEPVRLPDRAAVQLMERFGPGNRRLCGLMGISCDGLIDPPRWPGNAVELA